MTCAPNPGLVQMVQDFAPSLGAVVLLAYAGLTATAAAFLAPIIASGWRGE